MAYVFRLRSAFRKTFATDSGRTVLAYFYTHLGGHRTSMPNSCDPIELAFNEGKRFAWLMILEQLRENDQDMRTILETDIAERARELEAGQ